MESQHAAQQKKLFHLIVSLGETSYEYVESRHTLPVKTSAGKGSSAMTTC